MTVGTKRFVWPSLCPRPGPRAVGPVHRDSPSHAVVLHCHACEGGRPGHIGHLLSSRYHLGYLWGHVWLTALDVASPLSFDKRQPPSHALRHAICSCQDPSGQLGFPSSMTTPRTSEPYAAHRLRQPPRPLLRRPIYECTSSHAQRHSAPASAPRGASLHLEAPTVPLPKCPLVSYKLPTVAKSPKACIANSWQIRNLGFQLISCE
ncbi:hypothetical protein LZ32DRAFT_281014 [Colletotrichum eremochloae]|nr:hypothetical protein LZ32DRAFT_281014 [Colletotrichum eremochloae]